MELFKLLGTIAIENDSAMKALDDTAEKASSTSDETQDAFSKIGSVAGTLAKGVVVAGAALGGAWLAAIEGSREYRAEMGLLEGAFQASGHSSAEAKKTYSDLNAVLGDTGQAVEAAQHIAMIADNEKEMNDLTTIGTGVFQRFGQSLPLEGLMEGILHTSSLGEVQGSLADALEWSGTTVDDFNKELAKCSTEEERQDLIMKKLKDTYGGAAEQYKETNKDVMDARKAQEKLTDAIAKLADIGEPILTAIKNKVAEMVSGAVPHLENFIQKVKDIIQWVKENKTTVDSWVAVIIGAGTAIGTFLLILNWGAIMTAAANAVKVVRTAILAMNAAMLANPIGLIVALLAGLVAAFVYLWNNVEGFRKFWKNVWKAIQEAASSAWKAITKTFSKIGSWFSDKFEEVRKGGKKAMDNLKKVFSDAWKSIKSVFYGWGSFFSGLWTSIKSKFSSIGTSLGTSMGNAVKSGMNRVISAIQNTINKGISLINSAIRLANKLPGISVGTVPKLSLPRLAKGGVLERGQVGLLEGSGAEAVVPLENNRAWLSKVAEDLNEIQHGNLRYNTNFNIESVLKRIVDLLENLANMKICLDSGAMVGELVPAIDGRLADRWSHAKRGNTR